MMLHKALLVPVFLYGNERVVWRVKEKSRIKAVQMNNRRSLLGIRKMDRMHGLDSYAEYQRVGYKD